MRKERKTTLTVVRGLGRAFLCVAGMALQEGEVAPYGGNVQWVLALPGEPGPPERHAPKMGMASVAECSRCGMNLAQRRVGEHCDRRTISPNSWSLGSLPGD